MTQQQLSNLQDALNQLLRGENKVLLDPGTTALLPEAILRLLDNQKTAAVEKLLEQIQLASRSADKDTRLAAAAALIGISTRLARAEHWDILDKSVTSLKTIAGSPAYTDDLRAAAAKAAQTAQSRQNIPEKPAAAPQKTKDPLTLREEQIFQLAAMGNKDVAKKQLFDLVVTCARKKDFSNAERLRERIYEIDPMALMEIIQSGDIIEEEKSGAISKDHLDIWTKLLTMLSPEEFNSLYHEMEERSFQTGETIVAQNAKNDELFFINHGTVRASYTGGEKELFLKNLGSGEIAGENFFNASVWTVSLTAQQQTSLSVLKRENLARLEERIPGIESKLIDYYNRYSDINAAIKKKGMDRRVHERFKVEGKKIQLQVVDAKDRILSSFRGELTDISQGGLSFIIRITRKENSRLLLGRSIKASIPVSGAPDKILRGTVIGVQAYDLVLSDYSVHIKFNDELARGDMKPFIG
ncbi:MAG: cyclic nucleotide-binding domain-containing protein [Desulfobulbaceae bacterium]